MTSINIDHSKGLITTNSDSVLNIMETGAVRIGDGTYLDEMENAQELPINEEMRGALRYNKDRKCLQVCDGRVWNDVNGRYKQTSNITWSLLF